MNTHKTRPFLKYLGNKFRQMEAVRQLLPTGDRLVEHFVGSGAVFLNTNYDNYLLADSNADLINLFKMIAAHQEEFIEECKRYFTLFTNNLETYNFYRHVFNSNDFSLATITPERRINRACLFIYINRHCFHGITRYNSRGEFNVPFGYYEKIYFPEVEMQAFINKINCCDLVEFRVADFRETLAMVQSGDVVFCDPPYVPLTSTANFTKYYGESFGWYDQVELLGLCKKIKVDLGITSVISNHDTVATSSLYENEISSMVRMFVNRSISCKTRAIAPELMACI